MYIANPLGGQSRANLFSTHPPVRERIRRLRGYDEQASRQLTVVRSYGTGRWAA
jgi:hypothetical protein